MGAHGSLRSSHVSNTSIRRLSFSEPPYSGALEPSFGAREAEVQIVVALSRAESQVSSGENAGHRLVHVSVVRSLTKVGILKRGEGLSQDVHLNLGPASEFHNLRLIAFVQEPQQGRVLGSALLLVSMN